MRCPQAALAGANDSLSLTPHRLLFKQRHLLTEGGSLQAMLDNMSRNSTRDRQLLQSSATGIEIQSLGAHSGISMVQVPKGVSKADLLRALQAHPGLQEADIRFQKCSINRALLLLKDHDLRQPVLPSKYE